jgi:hypothetical protein
MAPVPVEPDRFDAISAGRQPRGRRKSSFGSQVSSLHTCTFGYTDTLQTTAVSVLQRD